MQKMYLQLILTLSSFFGALLSLLYVGLTYLYYYHEAPKYDGAMKLTWSFWAAIGAFFLCLTAFVSCVYWVKETEKAKKAKMKRYNDLMGKK